MQLTNLFALALVSAAAAAPTKLAVRAQDVYTIHPNGDTTKCVGVLGGAFVVGAGVDIYDCNGSDTQKWYNESPRMTNPADGSEWALDVQHDAGDSTFPLVNGITAVLNKSADGGEDGSPFQSWNGRGSPSAPAIRLNISSGKDMCLDLTNGSKANRNLLQIWECVAGNTNQVWTYTVVGQK
ncbi:ricin B lectin domain-containing protein [Mycena vitilis]|nr:ricin B lectin domain-containing protein [Mycena vitilis]